MKASLRGLLLENIGRGKEVCFVPDDKDGDIYIVDGTYQYMEFNWEELERFVTIGKELLDKRQTV